MGWTAASHLAETLAPDDLARLDRLLPVAVAKGAILFQPGDAAKGFVIVLSGRIEVYLTGPTGREILLYAVEPGGSCVQTTLGLLGGEDYTGEALAATDCRLILVPRPLFMALMDGSAGFRGFVFGAFAARMQDMMHLLERVAFQRVESRLAQVLLDRAEMASSEMGSTPTNRAEMNGAGADSDGPAVLTTQAALATQIGSAREVVSRRLEALGRAGIVRTERGRILILDVAGLRRLAAASE